MVLALTITDITNEVPVIIILQYVHTTLTDNAHSSQREEQAKLARIYRCQETAKNFDKKVRPFLDTMMHATEGQGGSRAF